MAESLANRLGSESHAGDGEDRVLAGALARREPAVFDKLVQRHQAGVARLAARLLAWPGDVDDVVQDVFLAAWKALPRFRGQSAFGTWLTRITINKCRSHRRREILRLHWLRVRQSDPVAVTAAADQAAMGAESAEEVRRGVQRLPVRYREVVVLRYLEQMPVEMICEVLGLTRVNVEVRLHRARGRLKKELAGMLDE